MVNKLGKWFNKEFYRHPTCPQCRHADNMYLFRDLMFRLAIILIFAFFAINYKLQFEHDYCIQAVQKDMIRRAEMSSGEFRFLYANLSDEKQTRAMVGNYSLNTV